MLTNLRRYWGQAMAGFSSGQKAVVGVAVLAVLVGGYLFMSWAGQPTYVPLFSNLSSSDAAAITQKLATNKVPYQLAENGQQIMVPQNDVYQQRLDMAAAGLPASGSQGYSLLDTAGVTTSQFQQQVEYQQAVSDELQQTIASINGVSSSQVNVVIPQQSLFNTATDSPTASVLVTLLPGATLSPEQVQAVVHLVASSIEGLSPDNVTVVDQNGDMLNAPGSGSGNAAAGSMDQQEAQSYEQSLDNSLQDMLATVLGTGNAVVHSNATLNFDQTQISSQIYNPNNQPSIPVQQATSKETYTGSAASQAALGVLGAGVTTVPGSTTVPATSGTVAGASASAHPSTAGNTPTTVAGSPGAGGAKTATTATTATTAPGPTTTVPTYNQVGASQQNVVSEVTKTVNSAPGALERLSIAVVVNSSVKGVSANEVRQLVTAAAGLQTSRGDSIQVAFVPFNQTAAQQQAARAKAQASAASQASLMGYARDLLVVLFVIALLVFALRRLNKTTRVPLALPAGYQQLALGPGDDYEEEEDMTMALEAVPVAVPERQVVAPAPALAEATKLGQMIEREPERIAELLRSWLETGPGDR